MKNTIMSISSKPDHFLVYFILLILPFNIFAQAQIDKKTNKTELNKIADFLQSQNSNNYKRAIDLAGKNNWPVRIESQNGSVLEIRGINPVGMPEYYITHNQVAANTVSASQVQPDGIFGLSLTGNQMEIGQWDAGVANASHREIINRVINMDGSAINGHSAGVAGTLIASGLNKQATGMASRATILAYNWSNDNAEMANAAANGLLISNHSYGMARGWNYTSGNWFWLGYPSIDENEDYAYGFYDNYSRAIDEIAFNAPYYLIVKAAGNERNTYGPADGVGHYYWTGQSWSFGVISRSPDGGEFGFDCMDQEAICKNILTVGAVNDIPSGYRSPSDVVLISASSLGPADDGRIKPDIVANGSGLFTISSASDSSYSSLSGTSAASPNAAGSLLLLQEHYKNLFGSNMFAATLKGLAIHTADEAGENIGPDYRFGWGLLNTAKAAQVISGAHEDGKQNILQELSLAENDTFKFNIYSDGNMPLKATICWTDPAGIPVAASLNPRTKMLINDLDLRITKDEHNYLPWVLDPDNPSEAAQHSDNSIDNVEQILIESPESGYYTISISHKNSLTSGTQNFSLIVSGTSEEKFISLTSPQTGEIWVAGTEHLITWESVNYSDQLKIQYSINDGITWVPIDSLVQNTGSYLWLVPAGISNTCKIKLSNAFSGETGNSSLVDFSIIGLEAVADLRIAKESNRLNLSWSAVIGAEFYNIYRDTTALLECDSSTYLVSATSTSFDDFDDDLTNDVIGNIEKNYYYAVTSANSVTESVASAIVGEYDFKMSAGTKGSFNAFSLCLADDSFIKASDILNEIEFSENCAYWNADEQKFKYYQVDSTFNDFNLIPGNTYYVTVSDSSIFTLVGTVISPSFDLIVTTGTDFNSIVLPLTKTGINTAADLMGNIPNCNSVAYWNNALQRYIQYTPIFPVTNFKVTKGKSYFINITKNTSWP